VETTIVATGSPSQVVLRGEHDVPVAIEIVIILGHGAGSSGTTGPDPPQNFRGIVQLS